MRSLFPENFHIRPEKLTTSETNLPKIIQGRQLRASIMGIIKWPLRTVNRTLARAVREGQLRSPYSGE